MYLECPVIAVSSGGPKETVIHGETGYLCSNDASSFSLAMQEVVGNCLTRVDHKSLRDIMGLKGRQRVLDNFTNRVMSYKLNAYITSCIATFGSPNKKPVSPLQVLKATPSFKAIRFALIAVVLTTLFVFYQRYIIPVISSKYKL